MKRVIIIIVCILFSVCGYSQNNKKSTSEDVTISINISKINRTLGNVFNFIKSEANQFKQEFNDNITEEQRASMDSLKTRIKYEARYTHDAIHAGFVQGLRGESYTPPYQHKYIKK